MCQEGHLNIPMKGSQKQVHLSGQAGKPARGTVQQQKWMRTVGGELRRGDPERFAKSRLNGPWEWMGGKGVLPPGLGNWMSNMPVSESQRAERGRE